MVWWDCCGGFCCGGLRGEGRRSALGLEPLLRSQLPPGLIHDGDDAGSRAAAAHFPRAKGATKYASGVEGYVTASPKLAFVRQTSTHNFWTFFPSGG